MTTSARPLPGDPSPSTLRHLRTAGHVCLVITLLLFIWLGIVEGKPYDNVWKLVLAHIVSGRAGNAGLGLEMGFNPFLLFYQCCMQDFIIMFYVYPIFVSGYQHLAAWPIIGPALNNVHELAIAHKGKIAPYGAAGLIIFVIFPFWSTGPLVGVIVGYLLGLGAGLTFTAVIIGDIIAVGTWIWAYDLLRKYNPSLAMIVLIIIFILAIAGIFLRRRSKSRKENSPHPPEMFKK